jgi:hypothetical protein
MIQSFYLPKDILERNVPPEEYWVDMTKEVILKLPYKFVLFDCLFDRLGYDFPSLGHINGTIRFILEK